MTARPVRITLPMLTFVPGAMGGSETYVRGLLGALARRTDVDVTVLVSADVAGSLGGNLTEVVVERVRGGARSVERVRTLVQALRVDGGARAALAASDVVHYPFTVPVPLPGAAGRPWVQSLLDVQHRDLPSLFGRGERLYRRVAYDRGARAAGRVLTLSQFSKARIVESIGVRAAAIDVALLGVDHAWYTRADVEREPFVFYPAAAWPHKNHSRLFAAVEAVRRTRPEIRLVLTGEGRERLGPLPDWVEHRGRVGSEELRELYRRAGCLAFPSLYEGFGLPPVEAMATGCPVAAAASGAVPEVCGDAAVLFDPMSVESIRDAILLALQAGEPQIVAGVERAAGFTWERCAEVHLASYRTAE